MPDNLLSFVRDGQSSASLPTRAVRALGIDLGTTNSTVAEVVWQPGSAAPSTKCLEVDQETLFGVYTHHLVPSVVAIHSGKTIVGEGAKRLWARAGELGLERDKTLFLECKNEIGTARTFHKAPPGFRSPAEIGAKVLSFLRAASGPPVPDRSVVTVPASFQAAQRIDTVRAAQMAGIALAGGDLLDEPVAAFLDYLLAHPQRFSDGQLKDQNLVVFDFGGGTCDVAVFQVRSKESGDIAISPLAVSRYHRLGGGDIDRAILYEILLPQIIAQNGLGRFDLSFEDKKNFIEPAFIGVAEALKVGLCSEISRLEAFGQYRQADKARIVKRQPGQHTCQLRARTLQLQSPELSAAQFEQVLAPFLDRQLLYARETEYRLTCSIFAPIQDALENAGIAASDVQLCLLVGGSSLIPQVSQAVAEYLKDAEVLTYDDKDSVQLAVARGAAWHALSLALFGRGLFELVAQDRVSITTNSGPYELIPRGAALPYPNDGKWAETTDLTVPDSSFPDAVSLLIHIRGGDCGAERTLFRASWSIPGPVAEGDRLKLEYRMDENQVLALRLTLADSVGATPFAATIENPLSNVVNPNQTRLRIQQAEENLRTANLPAAEMVNRIVAIARDYAELKQLEKAVSYLERALRIKNTADSDILNLMGIYYGELGNQVMEEKVYRECAKVAPGAAPLFNLALAQTRRGCHSEALVTVDDALSRQHDGPTLTLKARIADALKNDTDRDMSLRAAFAEFAGVRSMSEWELGWYLTAAQMAGDDKRLAEAQSEQRRRRQSAGRNQEVAGVLPSLAVGGNVS